MVASLDLSEADFDEAAQATYKANLAATAGNNITVDDITLSIATSRRRQLAGGITVTATIATSSPAIAAAAATAVSSAIATTASTGVFLGITVTATPPQPTTTVVVVPAPSSPPLPLSPPPASPAPAPPVLTGTVGPCRGTTGTNACRDITGAHLDGDHSSSTGAIIAGALGGAVAVMGLLVLLAHFFDKQRVLTPVTTIAEPSIVTSVKYQGNYETESGGATTEKAAEPVQEPPPPAAASSFVKEPPPPTATGSFERDEEGTGLYEASI